jgi:hypothetical protein
VRRASSTTAAQARATSVVASSVQLTADGAFGSATAITALTSPTLARVERPARRARLGVPVALQHLAGSGDLELEVGAVDGHGRQVGLAGDDQPVADPSQRELHPLPDGSGGRRQGAELVERQPGEPEQGARVALLAVRGDLDVVGDVLGEGDRRPAVVRPRLRGGHHDLAVDRVVGLHRQRRPHPRAAAQRRRRHQQREDEDENAREALPGWSRRRHGAIVPPDLQGVRSASRAVRRVPVGRGPLRKLPVAGEAGPAREPRTAGRRR